MPQVHHLSKADARRIAVRAQLLSAPRPTDLRAVLGHLYAVQVDLVNAVAPSPELVCWSRLGPAYRPGELHDLVASGELIEFGTFVRPAADIRLFRAEMALWPGRTPLRDWEIAHSEWFEANFLCRDDILAQLRADGPHPAAAFEDTCEVPWRSTGWTNNQNVVRMLDFMAARGEVAVAGRDRSGARVWDLAERVYPETDVVPDAEAVAERDRRRLTSLGIARGRAAELPSGERNDAGRAGEEAVVEGVRGRWRVDPEQLGQPFRGRAALLSPLDRLIFDRKRMTELFDFDYQLEMYKPKAKRRWGYYALPVLYGDRFVGKLDAKADLDHGVLRINALHRDVDFTAAMTSAVDREIASLARWLALDLHWESP
ncbi:DNA glycosylase AlkZ-like family protein [Flexivirga meconopsidis]|uniref:DNA glycosylase AlkZ-like family protein n=1 Tax=Flexivirga meconopsidis TaxID=2977121 RepID=UPI0022407F99|nr:crosslink repair DNA glycosylase YcaQ family protein [Flexivirga meconopsidis]